MGFLPPNTIRLGYVPPAFNDRRIPIANASTCTSEGLVVFTQRIKLPKYHVLMHIIESEIETRLHPCQHPDLLTIHYILEGELDNYLDASIMPFREREYNMYWIPAKVEHYIYIKPGRYCCFHICLQEEVQEILKENLFLFPLILDALKDCGGHINSDPYTITGTEMLLMTKIKVCNKVGAEGRREIELLVNELVMEWANNFARQVLRTFTDRNITDKELANICAIHSYMTENLDKSHDLEAVTCEYGMDKCTAEWVFESIYGVPYDHYFLSKRLTRAFALLDDPTLTSMKIARMLGYEKYSTFSIAIENYFGKSVAEIKEMKGKR
jgi:AraC-like DNA-binding protein